MSGNIPDVGCFNLQTLSGPRHVLWFESQSIKFGNSTHEQEAVHQQWSWDVGVSLTGHGIPSWLWHCGRFLRPNVKKVLLYYMDLLVKSEDLNQAVLHRSTYGIWLVVPLTGRCQDMPSVNCQLVNVRITTQKYDETCAPLVRLPFAEQNTKKRTAAAAARRVRGNGRVRETNRRGKWAFRRGSVLSEWRRSEQIHIGNYMVDVHPSIWLMILFLSPLFDTG
jgi:hypothetical protein